MRTPEKDPPRGLHKANEWLGRAWLLYFAGMTVVALVSTWRYFAE